MDPRLLRYYNLELQHLRETGAEFARQFPKVAARLGMQGLEVADPYVERLLEGVGFLAARVQLKLDAEFPRFTQALLEIIYPHYLAPTPAMLVAQFRIDPDDTNLAPGPTVPRGSMMSARSGSDDSTSCEFRTAHDVTLWPIEIASASYFAFAPDLPLTSLPLAQRIRGGLRIRLKATAGLQFGQLPIDRLSLYVGGRDDVANALYELCLAAPIGVLVVPPRGASGSHEFLPPASVRSVGFSDDEALLPVTRRSFGGYRLLQEYFSFPQRYRFVELTGLSRAIRRAGGDELEIVVLFGRGNPTLEATVDASNLCLFCTPAINLFRKRADRIHVTDMAHEYHVVPDRTRPLDFEVYGITDVVGHGAGTDSDQRFDPLYMADAHDGSTRQPAYYTTRREPRLVSSAEKQRGSRSSYIGTEVFLSLVDASHAPYDSQLRQLSVQTWCTNRDLVLLMPTGGAMTDLVLDMAAPVVSIRVISGPSRPRAPLVDGAVAWRAINHLSLNYLSLAGATSGQAAGTLRDLLHLYVAEPDMSAKRQVEGLHGVEVRPVVRRLQGRGPLAFGRGLEIAILVEELAFEGGSAYLFGAVLEQYFARHVSINSFTETVLRSESRGEISRWAPQWGTRPTL